MSGLASSGRGGAGNMRDQSKTPTVQPEDLETPTLKGSNVVTTGRGGSGNMAANLDEEEKRRRQDVQPVARRPSHGAINTGRGGAGNVVNADKAGRPSSEEAVDTSDLKKTPSPKTEEEKKSWTDKLFGKKQ
ncbi:uncharacterized protein PODANS_1_7590 [Podospora anserina S mat+]|uniref:Podospora anserina S mat+ genomic DNA chromosome 1, supercontig 1 n=4 Tax=Podospora TaxID=5144 RepID=B2A8W2_PODAN|nr:uncharacterized protein PODANS_1_7590 [Podospora anserina S mat+]KAK4672961.1 hypothetical protein QC763_107590 [Podospora pseudopauciseta]KAK4681464.1 hypothetical protein QC764_107590 [Podospora pseudoanserina]VBB72189.1 Putative protein of unknown function [Podospora comata]CAP60463.1 unnamed protein product [Podospora anserina S mat+]CDP23108.1 Putative protein of unknown function [Podospora anserina S mat+]